MDIAFQLLWVNDKEHDCRIIWYRVCFILCKTIGMSSKVTVPFCIPTSDEWEFMLFYNTFGVVSVLDVGHSVGVYGISLLQVRSN